MPNDRILLSKRSQNPRDSNKVTKVYGLLICFLFVLLIVLASSNLITYSWYSRANRYFEDTFLRVQSAAEENNDLLSINDSLKKSYALLEENYNKILIQNKDIQNQLYELMERYQELEHVNLELADDNIKLQDSLEMAAAVGIKPQNYTESDSIVTRSSNDRGEYIGKFLGTAYTPSKEECGNDMGITNSGEPIVPGISIAIDKEYWPFGTIFYIKGLGYAVAMDTGSAIKGKYRFDFAVFDKNFAKQLGSNYWDVYLVKLGDGKVEKNPLQNG